MKRGTITVTDGFNGAVCVLDLRPLTIDNQCVKLAVAGAPHLIRWVRKDDWNKATSYRDSRAALAATQEGE